MLIALVLCCYVQCVAGLSCRWRPTLLESFSIFTSSVHFKHHVTVDADCWQWWAETDTDTSREDFNFNLRDCFTHTADTYPFTVSHTFVMTTISDVLFLCDIKKKMKVALYTVIPNRTLQLGLGFGLVEVTPPPARSTKASLCTAMQV